MSQKTVLITGSSSGFGLLTSVEMARRGWQVVATMRDLERRGRLDEAAAAAGVSARIDVRRLDVTEMESFPAILEAVIRQYGRLDALVNNAGFPMAGFLEDVSLDELRRQFETNFFGQVALTRAALPYFRRQRAGHILMISSVSGLCGAAGTGSYSASKFALEGWSESLRLEMNPLGVRVVLIEPGSFLTDIWEHGAQVAQAAYNESSPNHARALRLREFVRTKVRKADPAPVIRLIADVAEKPCPKLRYLIGREAKMQYWFRRMAPWRRYERTLAKVLKLGD